MRPSIGIAIIAGACFLFLCASSFAATLKLKDGEVVEGDIVLRDDSSVKMNVQGIELTYWADDIETLTLNDGTQVNFASVPAVDAGSPTVPSAAASAVLSNATVVPAVTNSTPSVIPAPQEITSPSPKEVSPAPATPAPEVMFKQEGRSGSMSFKPATLRGNRPENMAAAVGLSIFVALLAIALYVFLAVCLKTIAEKTGTANSWWAWIPIASLILMCDISGKPRWWAALFLLGVIPFVGAIVLFILSCLIQMDIAVRRGKPNWWGVLMSLPIINFFAYGYVAFSK